MSGKKPYERKVGIDTFQDMANASNPGMVGFGYVIITLLVLFTSCSWLDNSQQALAAEKRAAQIKALHVNIKRLNVFLHRSPNYWTQQDFIDSPGVRRAYYKFELGAPRTPR